MENDRFSIFYLLLIELSAIVPGMRLLAQHESGKVRMLRQAASSTPISEESAPYYSQIPDFVKKKPGI